MKLVSIVCIWSSNDIIFFEYCHAGEIQFLKYMFIISYMEHERNLKLCHYCYVLLASINQFAHAMIVVAAVDVGI